MEPDIKEFLVKVMQSISMVIVWLLINMSVGIYFSYAFFEGRPTTGNYIYYVACLVSFTALIVYLKKKWKENPNSTPR